MTRKPSRRQGRSGSAQLSIWDAPDERTTESPVEPTPRKENKPLRQLARCNAAMLAWARSTGGYSPEQAARGLRVKEARLLEWEDGGALPTVPQLRKLARLYRRPLAAFYLPTPPTDFTLPKDYRRLPGEPPAQYSPELLVGLRMATYRRAIALELDADAAESPAVGAAAPNEPAEALAARGRAMLGISLEEQRAWKDGYAALNGWKNAVEGLGVLVFHFTDVPVEEVRGFSFGERVLPVIGLNGGDSVNGRIFTLIHEYCHLLLGTGGSCDVDFTGPSARGNETEVFCNRFAGALLVPRDALLADSDVSRADRRTEWSDSQLDRIARQFRVSREVVLRRLLILERTEESFYQAHRAELLTLPPRSHQGSTSRPSVAVMAVRDVGKPFARLVLDAYYADVIGGHDVADYLGVRLKHLPAIGARLAGPDLLTGGER